jgi:nitrate/TMAO reductase-like tetraheme cytochrome c subunit
MNDRVLVLVLLGAAVVLVAAVAARPEVARGPMGRAFAFVAVFALPAVATALAFGQHLERAKSRSFCLSCHVMEPYGKSLYVDDKEFVGAAHFQNNRIARDEACYTCHTSYAMFGGMSAKLRGLRHLAVQYFGTIPDTLELYSPYQNRECMHCHEGARRMPLADGHQETDTTWAAIQSGKLSCMASGCHDVVHQVHELGELEMWKERGSR